MDRWIPFHVALPRWSRRFYLFIIFIIIFLVIFGPSYFRWIFYQEPVAKDTSCEPGSIFLNLRKEADKWNARVDHYPDDDNRRYALFIGNGHFGVPLNGDFSLYVKSGRTLSLHVPYYPDVKVQIPVQYTEETGVHYTNGIAYIDKCYDNKIRATYTYYAHRTLPSIFVQEISVKNSYKDKFLFDLTRKGHSLWDTTVTRVIKLPNIESKDKDEYTVISGKVLDPYTDKILIVSIVTNKIPPHLEIPAVEIVKMKIYTSIVYTRVTKDQFNSMVTENENRAITYLKLAIHKPYMEFKQDHINVWNHLWNTGFSISHSKATGALNGDQINATIYNVLSSVPALFHEETSSTEVKSFVTNSLSYVEGCYGSNHHTLEADNLWGNMESIDDINNIVSLWLLTLEKQGCYNLVKAGADGVIQAMVLSFGSFRFNKQHLEFNMHPSYLHRTYNFRRINYGNQTHVNVTVEVDDNDKAILYVALDRSDKAYFACDGGCKDSPVPLGPNVITLPVKLTKPFTAILYITSDKQHMEELRHTLHVKEIAEAPAQERTIIIMHKHGHHLGGLPTFFWVSIFVLIVIFHLFLIKLIYNEYWNQDKYKQKQPESHPRSGVKYRFLH